MVGEPMLSITSVERIEPEEVRLVDSKIGSINSVGVILNSPKKKEKLLTLLSRFMFSFYLCIQKFCIPLNIFY